MKQTKDLKIHYVPVGKLKPAPYNPRKWDKVAEEKLKESIKRFGLVDPFIVNATPKRKNTIIGGHFRFEMAKKMGFKEVPVVYVDIPSLPIGKGSPENVKGAKRLYFLGQGPQSERKPKKPPERSKG